MASVYSVREGRGGRGSDIEEGEEGYFGKAQTKDEVERDVRRSVCCIPIIYVSIVSGGWGMHVTASVRQS